MDPAVELYFATGDARYLELAQLRLAAGRRAIRTWPCCTRALAGVDASEIATGKAYQLAGTWSAWPSCTAPPATTAYRMAVDNLWHSIRNHHLTLGGGPWGGVAHRSREVFNPAGVFSPQAYVETCSMLAWIQLNRELLAISGEARYAEEIERTRLQRPARRAGAEWRGLVLLRRSPTAAACTPPTGAAASPAARWRWRSCPRSPTRSRRDGNIAVNLLRPGRSRVRPRRRQAGCACSRPRDYPFDGAHPRCDVAPEHSARFALSLRIPAMGGRRHAPVNGVAHAGSRDAGQLCRDRTRVAGRRRDPARLADAAGRPIATGQPQRAGIARARRLAGAPASAALRVPRRSPAARWSMPPA